MNTLTVREARRLALLKAGLLKPEWIGLKSRVRGETSAREAALGVIRRFGYLQLDTVSVAGARSHSITLLSRINGFPATLGEELLRPGEPLFEYWGHEVSWIPIEMYPLFAFRRDRHHPWWGDVISKHRDVADDILRRIRDEGPLRSSDLEGKDHGAWWAHRPAKKVIVALWSTGVLAIRERRAFQRTYDLADRVIPAGWREATVPRAEAVRTLLLKALDGHGWAGIPTLAATWRLLKMKEEVRAALETLREEGLIEPCAVVREDGSKLAGWIRPADLAEVPRLARLRLKDNAGVFLSPFDPLLWDRRRVGQLFGFEQTLEIFKPADQRIYGYYCLPILAGEKLVARFDLKAERPRGVLRVVARHFEEGSSRTASAAHRDAARVALERYAEAVKLKVAGYR